jgi:hypothetical protein
VFIRAIDAIIDEIPVDSSTKTKANMKVNPGDAYYPWLSKAVSVYSDRIRGCSLCFQSTS